MPEHSTRIYAALKQKGVPCMAFFHQGGHCWPPPLSLVNQWFSRFLYGVDNDILKGPKAWIVREGDNMGSPTSYPDYPHPDAVPVTLFPAGKGLESGVLSQQGAGTGVLTLSDDWHVSGQ